MHSSPNWRVDRARESLLLPILNFASTTFLICSLQSSFFFPCVACFLLSFFSVQFFLPNTKLKAYKNHHKDSKGKDFLFHITVQASCLFSHFVKSPYFVKKKKKKSGFFGIFSIKIWIFGMKNHGKLTF